MSARRARWSTERRAAEFFHVGNIGKIAFQLVLGAIGAGLAYRFTMTRKLVYGVGPDA